ncbi:MAG: dihydropteroate synthase [Bacteroidales bacterium]|nr:dihydropteroate synthase [Bacteroidales bacterium]
MESRDKNTEFSDSRAFHIGDKILSFQEPLIMGILNITEDSFFDGGKYLLPAQYLKQAERMLEEGAHIIDVGAISTRPGSVGIPEMEEMQRISEVLSQLSRQFRDIFISVDTYRSAVARMAFNEGASIINDISGGTMDGRMLEVISEIRLPYVMMHMQGTPETMQLQPSYNNVVEDVLDFFRTSLEKFNKSGVNQLIVDPGFGFGKTLEHNYILLQQLNRFKALGQPILVGLSRKSMVCRLLDIKPQEALHATGVLNTLALLNGADILRVHDVKEASQVIKVVRSYKEVQSE